MFTKKILIDNLKQLGITKGDVLFIRLSYKAIGRVEGGPKTVVEAILETIGPSGTLIATAFPPRQNSFLHSLLKKKIYIKGLKPSTGIIPLIMSNFKDAHFSTNPITPFVAIGKNAEEITNAHTPDSAPYSLIESIAINYNAKCLRCGGNVLVGTTHIAFTKALESINATQIRIGEGIYYYENNDLKWKEKNVSCFCYNSYKDFYFKYLKNQAIIAQSVLGDSEAVVTDMYKTYTIEHKILYNNPQVLLCEDPNCLTCRCSYSYSKQSIISYIFKQFINFDKKKSFDRIKDAIKLMLFGKSCT